MSLIWKSFRISSSGSLSSHWFGDSHKPERPSQAQPTSFSLLTRGMASVIMPIFKAFRTVESIGSLLVYCLGIIPLNVRKLLLKGTLYILDQSGSIKWSSRTCLLSTVRGWWPRYRGALPIPLWVQHRECLPHGLGSAKLLLKLLFLESGIFTFPGFTLSIPPVPGSHSSCFGCCLHTYLVPLFPKSSSSSLSYTQPPD